ncbi:MAG TPA: DNA replication and repair protein RecF [Gemmatimonadaceae bacterium]
MVAPRARLRTLALRDFRNFMRLDVALPAEGLVLLGENGQGKTNFLEAIHYLELFRSERAARDADLVRFGAPAFHVAAAVETPRVHEVRVGFEKQGKRKRLTFDGAEPPRLSEALGALPSVLFSPGDVALVSGAPAVRRRYLDIVLALASRPYLAALQKYRGALVRRNAALRDAIRGGGRGDQRVAVWEEPLAEHGAVLWGERLAWVAQMASRFAELCAAIGERAPVAMRYQSATAPERAGDSMNRESLAGALAAALAEKRALDVRRGVTHAGPHRDDLVLELDGRELRAFGSAGQQRTAAIALRMLESATLRDRRGTIPLLLLDDPFAELDARRAARIVELLADEGLGQAILTVPRASDVPAGLPRLEQWRIAAGVISGATTVPGVDAPAAVPSPAPAAADAERAR